MEARDRADQYRGGGGWTPAGGIGGAARGAVPYPLPPYPPPLPPLMPPGTGTRLPVAYMHCRYA